MAIAFIHEENLADYAWPIKGSFFTIAHTPTHAQIALEWIKTLKKSSDLINHNAVSLTSSVTWA